MTIATNSHDSKAPLFTLKETLMFTLPCLSSEAKTM